MKIISKILNCLPVIIVGNWVFCFLFLKDSQFYNENYFTFDLIDTFMCAIALLHYFFCPIKNNVYLIRCIIAIIFLNSIYELLNEQLYFSLYLLIITSQIFDYAFNKISIQHAKL